MCPIRDRIDIHLETHVPSISEFKDTLPLSSKEMVKKVMSAHKQQTIRYQDYPFDYNSQIPPSLIKRFCALTSEGETLLNQWFSQTKASIRAYDKILRLSRTLADLEEATQITSTHIAEALQYRLLDRHFWA